MPATLVQLNVSPGGMPKLPILSAVVSVEGVPGDWQLNRKYHGGPDRAICVFSLELYDRLRSLGIDLQPGAVGENFTTQGIDLQALEPGDQLRVGQCAIELSEVRAPCRSLGKWSPHLMKTMLGHSGWVAKVVEPGAVKPGDQITLIEQ